MRQKVKPVHPTTIRTHGLFGSNVRYHMMTDDAWQISAISEEFKGMTNLLRRSHIFGNLDSRANREKMIERYRQLRHQCHSGHIKLKNTIQTNDSHRIHQFLNRDKRKQRLYQHMPIHLVTENINEHTFVMRRERDRLEYRLKQLKSIYEEKILECGRLQHCYMFHDIIPNPENREGELKHKIDNSNVRIKAIKMINVTYKKMIQVLRHDRIFFEPIISSLDQDIADQQNFIKYILSLGLPAISKLNQLNDQYRHITDRRSTKKSARSLQELKNSFHEFVPKIPRDNPSTVFSNRMRNQQRYMRDTPDMSLIYRQLYIVQEKLKDVKTISLCSRAKEIFSRLVAQRANNLILIKSIEKDSLRSANLYTKALRAQVLKGVLIDNVTVADTDRLEEIEELKAAIQRQEKAEAAQIDYIKNRSDSILLMRCTLWNISEILRHVHVSNRIKPPKYQESYLNLPLLKFEMLNMMTTPPLAFESSISDIMKVVKRKIARIMSAYQRFAITDDSRPMLTEQYEREFLGYVDISDQDFKVEKNSGDERWTYGEHRSSVYAVPSRRAIKYQSQVIVEHNTKLDQ